ncbi:GNAT family N-acetyltransferase [Flavobacterium sp. JP2137]|uniref:GNAT family N-acetyltransferase n=1 Tax=Flavobacterium sp. JP2137 TaxID=3414510 RepID=UPI003D2FF760
MILETERLQFVAMNAIYIPSLLNMYNDAQTMKYIPNNLVRWTEADLMEKWAAHVKNNGTGMGIYALIQRETGDFIGQAGVYNSFDNPKDLEIGYILGSRFWNEGYGTEICRGLINYCFCQLDAQHVSSRMYAHNIGSVRVSEKSSMQLVEKTKMDDERYRLTYRITRSTQRA